MLKPADRETFSDIRPFIVGLLAVLFRLRDGIPDSMAPKDAAASYFEHAESFAAEFDRRSSE